MVHVWNPKDGVNMTTLTTEDDTRIVTSLAFSPDGRYIAVLADASVIFIFNWIKGNIFFNMSHEVHEVNSYRKNDF